MPGITWSVKEVKVTTNNSYILNLNVMVKFDKLQSFVFVLWGLIYMVHIGF